MLLTFTFVVSVAVDHECKNRNSKYLIVSAIKINKLSAVLPLIVEWDTRQGFLFYKYANPQAPHHTLSHLLRVNQTKEISLSKAFKNGYFSGKTSSRPRSSGLAEAWYFTKIRT
jgi:hypothetical protein